MTSSKILINDFLDKIFTQRKISGFERSLQVSGRYTNECKSYGCLSLENIHTFILQSAENRRKSVTDSGYANVMQ